MLILIPGATGNLGQHIVRAAFRQGHQVRALGRTPKKMAPELSSQLESFVLSKGWDDVAAIDKGCAGVDAIICAYGADLRAALDGQLILLRAAERAGIKRFHAASWNLDWSKMPLDVNDSYDGFISFARHAALTSPIKPIYSFTGALAMTLFGVPGAGAMEGDSALWVRKEGKTRELRLVGKGETKIPFSPEEDVGEFTVAIVTGPEAEEGGYYRYFSDSFTPKELAAKWEKVTGGKCEFKEIMDLDTCKKLFHKQRSEAKATGQEATRWYSYVGLCYAILMDEGTYNFDPVDVEDFPQVHRTSVEEYMKNHDFV